MAHGTDPFHLRATPAFRSGVLLVSLAIIMLEVGVFVLLWRIGTSVDPGRDPRAAGLFVALGSVLTLQTMGVVGVLWVIVAVAWTTLTSDIVGLSLEHPWRSWQGRPAEVTRAWRQRGWLVLELNGQWRRWYVRATDDGDEAVNRLRGQLRDGVWLDDSAARGYLASRVLPVLIPAVALSAVVLMWVLRTLDGLMHNE